MPNSVSLQAGNAPVALIGGGGHARALMDVLSRLGCVAAGIITTDKAELGREYEGVHVRWLEEDFLAAMSDIPVALALGNRPRKGDSGLCARAAVATRYTQAGARWQSVISPLAIVSPSAMLGEAVQVMHGVIMQPSVNAGAHTILNTGAIIEHDAHIGAHCHIAPGAVVCGGVRIADYAHIGANATLLPGVTVGEGAVVGAGMRVTRDVSEGETIYVPAV